MAHIKDIKYSEVVSVRYCCDRCTGHRTYENSFIHLVVQKNSSEDDWEKVPCSIRNPYNNHRTSLGLEALDGEYHDFISYLNSGGRLKNEDFRSQRVLFWALKCELSDFLSSLITEQVNLKNNINKKLENNNEIAN